MTIGHSAGGMADIQTRKADHLDLTARGDVGFRDKTNLLECVQLVHCSLPELALDELDTSCTLLGKQCSAPLLIAGMTGGTERAQEINRVLASVAQQQGYAFGLGSQRAMLTRPETRDTFRVRDVAPSMLLLGNIGVVQAAQLATSQIEELVDSVGADALCVHLNPAMELIQADGDRDFRGCEATFERLARELSVPVIAKETGSGLSRAVGRRLAGLGVRHVDVSGAGGTSWVAVETHRAEGEQRALGELFWDWGIPTAASVLAVAGEGAGSLFETVLATGGVKNGLDVARALALGASAAGLARPVLQAYDRGGEHAVLAFLRQVESELKTAMLLVGARNLRQLRAVPRAIEGRLQQWQDLWRSM